MELIWRAYERAPEPVVTLAGRARELYFASRQLRVPLFSLTGVTPTGRTARVLAAGASNTSLYLQNRIFHHPPVGTPLGTYPVTRLRSALDRHRGDHDLTVASVLRRFSGSPSFAGDFLCVPTWLLATLPTPASMEEMAGRSKSTLSDFKLVRKNELRPVISHDRADFDRFYSDVYVPYARNRHKDEVILRSAGMMRRMFHQGGIMWINRGTETIAGLLYTIRNGAFHLVSLGTVGGKVEPLKIGALAAIYFFGADLARQSGCGSIDFGGTRPCPKDGVLQFKRKWGIGFELKKDAPVDVLVRWEKPTALVREFLEACPLIFKDGAGLTTVAAAPGLTPTEAEKSLRLNGVGRLHLVSCAASASIEAPATVVLGDPLHPSASVVVEAAPASKQGLGSKPVLLAADARRRSA